jgi:hypothetical protein
MATVHPAQYAQFPIEPPASPGDSWSVKVCSNSRPCSYSCPLLPFLSLLCLAGVLTHGCKVRGPGNFLCRSSVFAENNVWSPQP